MQERIPQSSATCRTTLPGAAEAAWRLPVSLSLDLSRDPEGGFVDWAWGNVLFLVSTLNSTLNWLVEDGWTNIV